MQGRAEEPGAARRTVQESRSAPVLRAGLAMSDLAVGELWIAYVGLGGTMSAAEVEAVLRGERQPSAYQHDVLAQALNDYFTERGQDHPVAYADDLDDAE